MTSICIVTESSTNPEVEIELTITAPNTKDGVGVLNRMVGVIDDPLTPMEKLIAANRDTTRRR